MTVRDARAGTQRDLEVIAAPASSVGSLLGSLPVPVDGRSCFVGSVVLDPSTTIADSPLLHGSVISVGAPGPAFRAVPGEAGGVLEVTDGPDSGLTVALGPGAHTVARSSEAAVCLRDTEVSRGAHATLEISADGDAVVVNERSTNGTFVDGVPVDGSSALHPGSVLQIGSDILRWVPRPAGAVRTTCSGDGRLDFDRTFAAAPSIPQAEVTLPAPPAETGNSAARAMSALLPVGGAALLALAMHRPVLLWFGLGRVLELSS
ncbi:FHA domain-containing protein [Streptomyces sp. NPDC086080]|uniref:FHA domain-containing protein n=1 Tax=Streptomyces sp. NPDC086080 TaxID=3365748 RepID=UPI0037D572CC